jgi:hypothetical protein
MFSPVKPSPKPQSSSDSFFGMALAQAFTGLAFGPMTETVWEAAEMTSAIYEDRSAGKTTKSGYELGVRNSLAHAFERTMPAQPLVSQIAPFMISRAPAPAYVI